MKRFVLLFSGLLICRVIFAQCVTTNTLLDNLTPLRVNNPNNINVNDVLLKPNAITINGVSYDALITMSARNFSGQGTLTLTQINPGSINLRFTNFDATVDPVQTYNIKIIKSGSATTTNLTGEPVSIQNLTVYLPDIDGTANLVTGTPDLNRMYVDLAGYQVINTAYPPVVTAGSGLIQADLFNSTKMPNYIKYRPVVPSRDYSDNNLTNLSPTEAAYSLNLNFPIFPPEGINLLFAVTADPAQTNTLPGLANRALFNVLGVNSCRTVVLPVSFESISAQISNGELSVKWKTLTETDNDRFYIEASKDGENFTRIKEVKSTAINGNSSYPVQYAETVSVGFLSGLLALFPFFIFCIGGVQRHRSFAFLLVAAALTITIYSCTKGTSATEISKDTTIFVRIAQVDQNGTISYSKVVKATRN